MSIAHLGAARERVRVARALQRLPEISRALGSGLISYAKARAISRVATPETETRLLAVARAGTAAHLEAIVRGWRRVDHQSQAKLAERHHAARALHIRQDDDGSFVVHGRLAPEAGVLLIRALDAAGAALSKRYGKDREDPVDRPTSEQQRADALALISEPALHNGVDPGHPGERYQVVLHIAHQDGPVDSGELEQGTATLDGGGPVSAETSRRLACDASRVVLRYGERGHVADVSAPTRTVPAAVRRALELRDRGCRFPGCGLRRSDAHHIRHWAAGGPTTLSNLTLLCRRHHRAIHEGGFRVERRPDGALVFKRPDGRVLREVPQDVPVPMDATAALILEHRRNGLSIDARTGRTSWLGERLDVGWAVSVLHPRTSRAN